MKSTVYTVITEALDSVVANEIDRLEGSRDYNGRRGRTTTGLHRPTRRGVINE